MQVIDSIELGSPENGYFFRLGFSGVTLITQEEKLIGKTAGEPNTIHVYRVYKGTECICEITPSTPMIILYKAT